MDGLCPQKKLLLATFLLYDQICCKMNPTSVCIGVARDKDKYINFIIQLGLLHQYMCNINPIYVFKFNVVTMPHTHHDRYLLVFPKAVN